MDIRLFHHYTTVVGKTIVTAGISNEKIWCHDVPELAFDCPLSDALDFIIFGNTSVADVQAGDRPGGHVPSNAITEVAE